MANLMKRKIIISMSFYLLLSCTICISFAGGRIVDEDELNDLAIIIPEDMKNFEDTYKVKDSTAKLQIDEITSEKNEVVIGQSTNVNILISNGVNPEYKYSICEPNSDEWITIKNYNSLNYFNFKPNKVGTYSFKVEIKDDNNQIPIDSTMTISVKDRPENHYNLSILREKSIDGEEVVLQASILNELNPSYSFTLVEPGETSGKMIQSSSANNSIGITPTKTGQYELVVNYSDDYCLKGITKSYPFDVSLNPKAIISPSNKISKTIKYVYDDYGQLESIRDSLGNIMFQFNYDNNGNNTQIDE